MNSILRKIFKRHKLPDIKALPTSLLSDIFLKLTCTSSGKTISEEEKIKGDQLTTFSRIIIGLQSLFRNVGELHASGVIRGGKMA